MARPLPGITFQAVPPDLGDKLPRMDVAAFVGFAAAGPINTPVVVEDEVHFRRIFGDDLDLAWDEAAGAVHQSYLGAAVRAFFRNGGRRCWVVRVASPQAVANRFLLPGLMRADTAGFLRAAPVRARSEGSWSDDLRTGATLTADPFALTRFDRHGDALLIELSRLSRETLTRGDLLRFTFPKAVLYLAVAQAETAGPVWRVAGEEHWFRREPAVHGAPSGFDLWVRRPEGRRRRVKGARWFLPAEPGGEHRICVPASAAVQTPGALLELETDNYPTLLLSVSETRAAAADELKELHLSGGPWTVLAGRDPLGPTTRRVGHALAWGVHEDAIRVERLTFDLWVQAGDAQPFHLDGMGFCPDHPRYLGDLPADVRLFGAAFHAAKPRPDGPAPGARLWPAVIDPRFPLAGEVDGLYLPIGMPFQMGTLAAPMGTGLHEATRNGMAAFDPGVFLDPDLEGLTADGLREAIFHKHDVLGEDLKGLHAIWPLEEVTLVALPDAIHPPWAEDVADVILPPPAPLLTLDQGELTWSDIPTATGYIVQVGADPTFAQATAVPVSTTTMQVPTAGGCPETKYYRVRAIREDQPGPWSNTIRILLDASDFEACQPVTYLEPPVLQEPTALGDHRYALTWSAVTGDVTYTVEEAEDPDFFGARQLTVGTETSVVTVRTGDKPAYYRVRAESADLGLVSPWSRTVWLLQTDPRQILKLQPDQADPQDQLRIHDGALRMALARGDLLTVLTLPAQAREEQTVAYVRSLIAHTEEQALTYGAVYHPWTWEQERLLPPDGAMAGQMARRALERGAWVAPANIDMAGVVALAPTLTPGAPQLFADNQINLVQRDPRGFLTLSADTLSRDEELRLINVRRLLILLRRLALREGAALVFEPNDETFRRLVQRRFEALLADMFMRGAFAGDSVDQAFRVVTDASVNPRQSVDAGRFVVELRVAPSKPLAFLTVRLIQTQGAGPAFQEV
jgi:hypothetical protein